MACCAVMTPLMGGKPQLPRCSGRNAARPRDGLLAQGKNDRNDAEAISEAASRPSMGFVPIKHIGGP